MAGAGPQIVAKFVADTSRLTSEVDTATSKAGSRLDGFAKNAALAIGGAFAVTAIVNFGKAAVNAAADDAEAQALLAAALKNTTGATDAQVAAAEDYISTLSKQAAIADDDLRPALATLARAFGSTEEAQAALTLATDVAAGTGKDLSAVTDAMAKAAMGNTGALKKMGIQVKNADGSAKSLDEIMAQMAQTFEGQASIAAESTAGQMRNAEIQMGELQETIGAKLLPVIGALAGFLVGTLFPAIDTVIRFLSDHQDVIVAFGIGLGAVGVVILASLVPAFIAWAVAAGAAAIATIAAAAPLIIVGAAVAALAYLIIKNWDEIVKVTKKVWDAILDAIRFVWDWLKANWPLLLAILTGPFGLAVLAIVKNWDTIKAGAQAVWDWLNSTWSAVTGFITAPIQSAVNTVAGFWTTIKNGAQEVYDFIAGKFDAIAGAISGAVGSIRGAAEDVADAIKAPINAVIGAFNSLAFTIPRIDFPDFEGLKVAGKTVIPGFTGPSIGGQTIQFPNLPRLASGAVLTSPTAFIGGEAGTELVTPEDMLRQIMREERGGYTLILQPRTADAADVAYGFRRLELMRGG